MSGTERLFHWTRDLGNPRRPGRLTVEGVGEVILTDDDVNMAALFSGDIDVAFALAPGQSNYFIVSRYITPNERD